LQEKVLDKNTFLVSYLEYEHVAVAIFILVTFVEHVTCSEKEM